jgi:hypothetical protein
MKALLQYFKLFFPRLCNTCFNIISSGIRIVLWKFMEITKNEVAVYPLIRVMGKVL